MIGAPEQMMKDIQQSTSGLKPAMAQELSHSLAEPGPHPRSAKFTPRHLENPLMGDSRVQGGCSKGRRNLQDPSQHEILGGGV